MPTQEKVFETIKKEREYQDSRWNEEGQVPDADKSIAEWLLYIKIHQRFAEKAVYELDSAGALHELRKIAALAVAALEVHGCPERRV